MNILDQSVNSSKILPRKLYNIPKCIPGVINFKDSNRYYMGSGGRSYTSQFPHLFKAHGLFIHRAFEVINNVWKALISVPHPLPEKILILNKGSKPKPKE